MPAQAVRSAGGDGHGDGAEVDAGTAAGPGTAKRPGTAAGPRCGVKPGDEAEEAPKRCSERA